MYISPHDFRGNVKTLLLLATLLGLMDTIPGHNTHFHGKRKRGTSWFFGFETLKSSLSPLILLCRNVLLGLQDFPHRRTPEHTVLPCRVGAELVHGKSAAHAPALKNERVASRRGPGVAIGHCRNATDR
jgi:hypothetical protein